MAVETTRAAAISCKPQNFEMEIFDAGDAGEYSDALPITENEIIDLIKGIILNILFEDLYYMKLSGFFGNFRPSH